MTSLYDCQLTRMSLLTCNLYLMHVFYVLVKRKCASVSMVYMVTGMQIIACLNLWQDAINTLYSLVYALLVFGKMLFAIAKIFMKVGPCLSLSVHHVSSLCFISLLSLCRTTFLILIDIVFSRTPASCLSSSV